ncbi:MAG: hypothetical protein OXF32_05275 [Anaerolineaceae bacterium]|nr:hypothetical protein [Anaerolineaceae bacterium]
MRRLKSAISGTFSAFNESAVRKAMPQRRSLLLMVLPFLLGLGWAYSISPTVYRDAAPAQLAQGWQNIWTQLLVERYRLAVNTAVTSPEFNENLVRLLSAVDDPVSIVRSLGISDAGFLPLVERAQLTSMAAPPEPSVQGDVEPFVVGPVVIVVGAIVLTLVNRLVLQPTVVAGAQALWRRRPGSVSMPTVPSHLRRREPEAIYSGDTEAGQPVLRRLSVYQGSGAGYDDSWEIQAEDKAFLGECGVTAADDGTRGMANISALEAWLFDKDDPVRSMTTIFATGIVVNDPTARAQLETRGNIVPLEPGATAYLETNALRLRVRVIDVVWGATGNAPSNSFLESATTEISVWHKGGFIDQGSHTAPTLPALNPAQATRPHSPPSRSAGRTRPSGPATDVTGPVVPPQEDPFDGSGDFRPVG